MTKKKKPALGDVIKIDLGDGSFGYGRVLNPPLMAFYDCHTRGEDVLSLQEIISKKIIFQIFIMKFSFKEKNWVNIGNIPLGSEFREQPKFFNMDQISGKLYIYDPVKDIPATREECLGLERAAVWDPNHIEDRLRDYFDGKPNKWVESLKLPTVA